MKLIKNTFIAYGLFFCLAGSAMATNISGSNSDDESTTSAVSTPIGKPNPRCFVQNDRGTPRVLAKRRLSESEEDDGDTLRDDPDDGDTVPLDPLEDLDGASSPSAKSRRRLSGVHIPAVAEDLLAETLFIARTLGEFLAADDCAQKTESFHALSEPGLALK